MIRGALIALLFAAPLSDTEILKLAHPVSQHDAQAILELGHVGAMFSVETIKANLMCRYGNATNCADGRERAQSAKEKSDGTDFRVNHGDRLLHAGVCHAMLILIAESWEIDWRLAALLAELKKDGLGKERLFVMQQQEELRKTHAMSLDAVRLCSEKTVGGEFDSTLTTLSTRYRLAKNQ